ncbi:hypothetical protein [Bacillus sp. B15-48]|uniref:hypothetical protein n=1 Tax=Bacillus sp. B15-48 TaxID=1548601 RepID=UPI00193FECCA|nr:hypothetical protein [Bacillus sp. B15-48]MBM4761308.1 hypothetical protein [Bacillus sp. B15-48]
MLIGIVLGPLAERSLRQSLIMSDGSMKIFFESPISIIFILLTCFTLIMPIARAYKGKKSEDKGQPTSL